MADTNKTDLLVIGAGPGGYAAAFRAADLGRQVTLVDPRPTLGGVCLNEGCIPSKALLHAAEAIRSTRELHDWGVATGDISVNLDKLRAKKESVVRALTGGLSQLAKKRKVNIVRGKASFVSANQVKIDQNGHDLELEFVHAIIATGSSPVMLPGWPTDPRIMDSEGALALRDIPKRLTIVGGGIIGLEMATVYSALGSDVTIIEMAAQIAPGADAEAVKILHRELEAQSCTIHCATRVEKVVADKRTIKLTCTGSLDGTIEADAVIQAVGRRANGHVVDADRLGIEIAENGTISVNAQCVTSVPHIFAVGDVTGQPMLAHRATHQGKVAAEVACGHDAAFDTKLIPSVAYTNPELSWVGLTSDVAKAQGVVHKVSKFPWAASGRNLASGGSGGLTKFVWCPQTHRILGATIIGPHAGELLAELTLAMEMGAKLDDIALTVHAHPTLSETVAFAAELGLGTCTDL